MKKTVFIICCAISISATAQDIILKRSGDEIQALVKEISDTEIKYKKFSNPAGVTYSIRRSEVFSITYENGSKDLFAADLPPADDAIAYPYPPVSRSYALGDLFDEGGVRGIVIRVTDGGRHGLLMFLEQDVAVWSTLADGEESNQKEFTSGSTDPEDGWKNMQTIRELVDNTSLHWSNFPAFSWSKDLGPGWYLPAQKEMESVWNFGGHNPARTRKEYVEALRNLNVLLVKYGGEEIPLRRTLWTSTEIDENAAHYLVHINAPFKAYTKGAAKFLVTTGVRAVHKF